MATLTADMKTFIENNLAWITTVDKDGNLDLGPKMSMFVLDDNHLAYHERTAGQHYRNLQDGSPLVIAVANLAEKKGYRFRGTVTLHTDDDIYDAQVKVAEEKGTKKPACMPEPRLSGLSIPAFVQRCRLRPAAERRRRAGDGLMSADAVTMPPLRDEESHAPHLARQ